MTVMVIGATGFIGGVLTARLVGQERHVIPVYRNEPEGAGTWWTDIPEKLKGDIRDKNTKSAIIDAMPDTCVYLVSLNHNDSAGPAEEVAPVNLLPVWEILEGWRQMGWGGRFIYMSTQQVYGRNVANKVDETTPTAPVNYYGLTHLFAENLCDYFARNFGLDAVALRLANSYGAPAFASSDCWWIVVNELVKMAASAGELTLKSDGSPTRDFLYVEDVADFIIDLAAAETVAERVMNVGSGKTRSIYEVAHIVQREYERRSGKSCDIIQAGKGKLQSAPIGIEKFIYDNRRACHAGFRERIDLVDGVSRLFDYLED